MIVPQRAPVKPRVYSTEGGATFPLEDEVQRFLDAGSRGILALLGPPGSGKTTALQHLAAVLPADERLLFLDNPGVQEVLAILLLDIRLSLIAFEIVAVGTVAHVSVEAREVFAPAVAARASSIVLAHNHPSGDAEPSVQDVDFTRAMVEAGRVLNIDVVNHLIVTSRSFYSFRSAGRL